MIQLVLHKTLPRFGKSLRKNACLSPNGKWLIVGGDDGVLRLYRMPNGELVKTFPLPTVQHVAFSPCNNFLAVDLVEGKEIRGFGLLKVPEGVWSKVFSEPSGGPFAFSHNQWQLLATQGEDASLIVYHLESETTFWRIPRDETGAPYILALAFSPDSRFLAAFWEAGFVQLWDVKAKSLLWKHFPSDPFTLALSFSPDGKLLLAACLSALYDPHAVRLIRVADGELALPLEEAERVTGEYACFSPDGQWIVGGSRELFFWSVADGKLKAKAKVHDDLCIYFAFTPDSKWFVTVGVDNAVKIWKVIWE